VIVRTGQDSVKLRSRAAAATGATAREVEAITGGRLDARTYLHDLLLRIEHEKNVAKLTPQGWRQHFAARRRDGATATLRRAQRGHSAARMSGHGPLDSGPP